MQYDPDAITKRLIVRRWRMRAVYRTRMIMDALRAERDIFDGDYFTEIRKRQEDIIKRQRALSILESTLYLIVALNYLHSSIEVSILGINIKNADSLLPYSLILLSIIATSMFHYSLNLAEIGFIVSAKKDLDWNNRQPSNKPYGHLCYELMGLQEPKFGANIVFLHQSELDGQIGKARWTAVLSMAGFTLLSSISYSCIRWILYSVMIERVWTLEDSFIKYIAIAMSISIFAANVIHLVINIIPLPHNDYSYVERYRKLIENDMDHWEEKLRIVESEIKTDKENRTTPLDKVS